MSRFLHWRKMTWALVLWSGYIATWMVVTASGPAIVTMWWLVGVVVFSRLWFTRQPLRRQGRGLDGLLAQPGWTRWRVDNLPRTDRGTEPRRDAG